MGKRYERYSAYKDGWSCWVYPIHGVGKRNYRLACCDCSLVHEIQFRVVKEDSGRISVKFRVSRNNRATAAKRRHDRKKIIGHTNVSTA